MTERDSSSGASIQGIFPDAETVTQALGTGIGTIGVWESHATPYIKQTLKILGMSLSVVPNLLELSYLKTPLVPVSDGQCC